MPRKIAIGSAIGHAVLFMQTSLARLQRPAAVVVLLLVALQFSAPFLVAPHRHPITTFDSEWIAAVVLGSALIVAAIAVPARIQANWPLPAVALGLAVVGAVQYLSGLLHYAYSLASLLIYGCVLISAYLLGRWLVASDQRAPALHAIGLGLLGGGVFSVAAQIIQVFDVRSLPAWIVFQMADDVSSRRPFANLAQPNHLATYLVWAAIAALYLNRRGVKKQILLGAIAILFCGLALTGSRMGVLLGLAVFAVVLTPNAIAPTSRRDKIHASIALAAGYAAGLVITAIFLVDSHGAMANAIVRFGERSLGQRFSMWSDAWRIALDHPWLGVGVGEYGGAQYLAAEPHPNLLATNNPHNLVLHVAAEFGLPVAAALVAVLGVWCWRHTPSLKNDPEVATAVALILVVLAHSLLEYPLWSLYFAIAVALLASLAEPFGARRSQGLHAQVLAPIGAAVLAASAIMKSDYEAIAPAWASYLDEVYAGRPHEPRTILGVTGSMGGTYFKPQMERLFVELVPVEAQQGDDNLALVGRVLTRLADVRVMVRYIELLLQAGRFDEAYQHIERLKVFAGPQYPILRDELLQSIAQNGVALDPVRNALNAP